VPTCIEAGCEEPAYYLFSDGLRCRAHASQTLQHFVKEVSVESWVDEEAEFRVPDLRGWES
jgi:hypothetical protein